VHCVKCSFKTKQKDRTFSGGSSTAPSKEERQCQKAVTDWGKETDGVNKPQGIKKIALQTKFLISLMCPIFRAIIKQIKFIDDQ
jgi:hypothetical protein